LSGFLVASVSGDENKVPTKSLSYDATTIVAAPFGTTRNGEPVELFTLTNRKGAVAKIMTYGATLTEWWVPDKNGRPVDVVLGFASLEQQMASTGYFGSIVGRYANRISGAKFTLDGKEYRLSPNHGQHTLHGGVCGFDKHVWKAEPMSDSDCGSIKFSYLSKDMEEGFPGNLATTVVYSLTNDNELKIAYEAKSDKPTPINLTNHAYFNLAGAGNGTILNHVAQINADSYTAYSADSIPTGEIVNVSGTPFDFRQPTEIGKRIDAAGGYDLNYVLPSENGKLAKAAVVQCPSSGLQLELDTTEPGMQFYAGINLKGDAHGIGGVYQKHAAFCLEAQHYPNSVNQPGFPSTILRPGETYRQTTVYKISRIQQ
jgi:aldose 1-epimerase